MKILFQIRPNAFTQRGGDTVDLERISAGLSALGVSVSIDPEGTADLREFDCVFLFNFTLPQFLRQQAEKAVQAGVPYVVLALNEDIPSFHAQSHLTAAVLMEYVKAGQPKHKFATLYPDVWAATPAARFENEWVARNAAIVFTTGANESRVLERYYPGLNNLCALPLGFDVMKQGSAAAFEAEFGVKDFVLSVGRIETRKNQLMLLKALEDEDLTVVIAGGGFTYQPDYDQAVKNFRRAGKTIVLGKLTETQLANAYAAAKIHALPSWYELPGLVSMEAANLGKNVVLSDLGTVRDYFGDDAFYCDPGCADSVRNAVLAALYSPLRNNLQQRTQSFTWDQTAKSVLSALQKVIPQRIKKKEVEIPSVFENRNANMDINATASGNANKNISLTEVIQEAEQIARTGEFEKALDLILTHKNDNPRSSALWRAHGMLLIALQRHKEANAALSTAFTLDPQDSRVVCGLGICAKQDGQTQDAHDLFVRSLQLDQNNKIAILQLLGVAYELNNFSTLEAVLKDYVASNSADLDMKYALSGCLFRQGKLAEAKTFCKQIITTQINHSGAIELLDLINKQDNTTLQNTPEAAPEAKKSQSNAIQTNPSLVVGTSESSKINSGVMEAINRISDLKRNHKITQGLQECTALLGNLSSTSPELEGVYALHGELMALDGQVVEAERRFNSILAQFPNSERALCGLGALSGEQRNWQKAEECFRKAIAINPKCDVGYAGLALSSLHSGDKEAAWHYYDKALAVNPENLRAVFGILELGYPEARYSDIERVLRNYLDLHPANLDFLYSLAGCFYAQNKLPEASQEIEKILMFSPGHPRAIELRQAIQTRLSSR